MEIEEIKEMSEIYESTVYWKLTDYEHQNQVIKRVGCKSYQMENGKWVRIGLSIGYFYPDAPEFDCYEEIPEEDALELLKQNDKSIRNIKSTEAWNIDL